MVKPNKTYNLDTTFVQNRDLLNNRSFVYTTSYADGNCFFHSLLRAIDIQYRKQNSSHGHLKLVEKFKKDLAEWITPDIFKKLGDGEQVRLYFLTEFNKLLGETNSEDPILSIVNKLLPHNIIDREILPLVLNKHSDSFYKLFCWECEKYIREQLQKNVNIDSQKINTICTYMRNYYISLFQQAHTNALVNFKSKMSTMGEFVDSYQMECISLYTGYNFVFIDTNKDSGYNGISHIVNFDDNRKCLVFLWVDQNHFDIVGELENKHIINRIFSADDNFILALIEQHKS